MAEVMKCNKKFEPWVVKNEEKMMDATEFGCSLEAARDSLEAIMVWKAESLAMKAVLDRGNKAAQLMSSHENADQVKKIERQFFNNFSILSITQTNAPSTMPVSKTSNKQV